MNKHTLTLVCAAVALAAAVPAFAKTTTWKGDSTGKFSDAGNWDNGAPEPGDTAKFTKAVTLVAGDFDLAADGLTVENTATVTWNVRLTGSGLFTKAGTGQVDVRTNAFHTGGTRLTCGKFSLSNRYCKPQCLVQAILRSSVTTTIRRRSISPNGRAGSRTPS